MLLGFARSLTGRGPFFSRLLFGALPPARDRRGNLDWHRQSLASALKRGVSAKTTPRSWLQALNSRLRKMSLELLHDGVSWKQWLPPSGLIQHRCLTRHFVSHVAWNLHINVACHNIQPSMPTLEKSLPRQTVGPSSTFDRFSNNLQSFVVKRA